MRYKELKAVEKDTSLDGYTFYANGVHVEYSHKDDSSMVATLSVNFGENSVSFLSLIEQDEEARKKHSRAVKGMYKRSTLWLEDQILYVGLADRSFIFYTIDFAYLIPKGWEVSRYFMIGDRLKHIGIGLNKLGYSHELNDIHIFTEEDFHSSEDEVCNDSSPRNLKSMESRPIRCQRKLGHLGDHQMFGPTLNAHWPTGHDASAGWTPPFGFRTECIHCGLVDSGSPNGKSVCFTCSYWIRMLKEPKLKRFVVNNRHYTAGGGGGFGGKIFELEMLDTGKKITTGLWGQGGIPEHFRDLFPNNAKFLTETYFP